MQKKLFGNLKSICTKDNTSMLISKSKLCLSHLVACFSVSLPLSFPANKRLVYEEVKKAVERDRSMVSVSELSKHGLMEIIRKRVCFGM